MRSIIEELAYGNITPEARSPAKDARYRKATELLTRHERHLMERLGAADKDVFEKYLDAEGEASQLVETKNFVYGFKLGLTMTAEAFIGMNALYVDGDEL
jgi:hypothetical protein